MDIAIEKDILIDYPEVFKLVKQEKIPGFQNDVYYGLTYTAGVKGVSMMVFAREAGGVYRAYHESEVPDGPNFHFPPLSLLNRLTTTTNRRMEVWRARCENIRYFLRQVSLGQLDGKEIIVSPLEKYTITKYENRNLWATTKEGAKISILPKLVGLLVTDGFTIV